ncbi:hypothetical protein [Pedobacter sp. Hv1]|uniref:hypothetical protein n=1 Tax=Pedobacter sp. Hv1 TaxID=1740090 RepID=UPI000AE7A7C7|nr:hypothetical protein [Pedobacter sp. Hv1]
MKLTSTQKTMKFLRTAGFFLLLCYACPSFGQLVPISLKERIENATIILEGKVISQAAYWDETQTHIYTANTVEVYKVFKGQLTAKQVEIITRGGIVGDRMERISNTLELKVGDAGVFTTIPNKAKINTTTQLTKLKAYAGIQGFIAYDTTNATANDVFNNYKNIPKELHSKIVDQTKSNFKTIQKAPFKIELQ